MTRVYRMKRRVCFSVKISAELKEDFTKTVKEKGFSTCFIIETLLTAWLEGLKAPARAKVDQSKTIVINQSFTRVVQRERRYGKHPEKNQWQDVSVSGEVNETNCFDPKMGWFYKSDEHLTERGHAVTCQCSECR